MEKVVVFILISIAVSGYVVSDKIYRYKYILPREEGQRLYLRSLFFGFPFFVISFVFSKLLFLFQSLFQFFPIIVVQPATEGIVIGVGTVGVGYLFSICYNFFSGDKGKSYHYSKAMMSNDFDRVLLRSMKELKPVIVTLSNRKVFVGIVTMGIEPDTPDSHLTILPLFSGHRDKDSLQFFKRTFYFPVLKSLASAKSAEESNSAEIIEKLGDYYVAFPRETIEILHLYNETFCSQVTQENSSTLEKSTG